MQYNVPAQQGLVTGREILLDNLRLRTHVRQEAAHPVLVVAGEIDVFTAPLFKQAIVNLVAEGYRHLFIDMSDVSFMDSSGFGALLSATKRLRPEGGSLSLIGCNHAIQRMLHLTRLDTILGVHPTLEAAQEAVRALA
jgi:anti-sigma B factor antagonist